MRSDTEWSSCILRALDRVGEVEYLLAIGNITWKTHEFAKSCGIGEAKLINNFQYNSRKEFFDLIGSVYENINWIQRNGDYRLWRTTWSQTILILYPIIMIANLSFHWKLCALIRRSKRNC